MIKECKEIENMIKKIDEAISVVFSTKISIDNLEENIISYRKSKDLEECEKVFIFWLDSKGFNRINFVKKYAADVLYLDYVNIDKKLVYWQDVLQFDIEGNIRECIIESIVDVVGEIYNYVFNFKNNTMIKTINVEDINDFWSAEFLLGDLENHNEYVSTGDAYINYLNINKDWISFTHDIDRVQKIERDFLVA